MANPLNREKLFPPEAVSDLYNRVVGESYLAKLSRQDPIKFNGNEFFTFNFDNEIDVVGESKPKSAGGISVDSIVIRPIKVEYSARVSIEFLKASQEKRIEILKAFNDGYAKKLAKGFDLMATHGVNPRTGKPSDIIAKNNFNDAVNQSVVYTAANPQLNIEDAIALIDGSDAETDGIALAPEVTSALSRVTLTGDPNGVRRYPEFEFGRVPDDLGAVRLVKSKNVSAYNNLKGLAGDFAGSFKWGVIDEIPLEIIPYGDPDGTGRDLARHNEILLRSETFLGWGILNPEAFAKITGGQDA